MPRRIRSAELETRTARLELAPRKKAYAVLIEPRIHLHYRRNRKVAGSWSVRRNDPGLDANGKRNDWARGFGMADDYEAANNDTVFDYWQALDKARELARASVGEDRRGAPVTVLEVVEAYAKEMERTGGGPANAGSLLRHLRGTTLAGKVVAAPLLKKKDFQDWRNGLLAKNLKPSSAERYSKSLAAALNLATETDKSIDAVRDAWTQGLKPSNAADVAEDDEESEENRDGFILPAQSVAAIVRACYGYVDVEGLGILVHVLQETGVRESQAFRLRPGDLKDDTLDKAGKPVPPFLMMPTSRKGSKRAKRREIVRRRVQVSTTLAAVLRTRADDCKPGEPLLRQVNRSAFHFRAAIAHLGLGPELTPYAMRYSSIANQLLQGVVPSLVATNHDTSVMVIEKFYTKHLAKGDDSAKQTRKALLDISMVPDSVVVPMPARRG